jgi:alpha-beta hydrolase superfamily lysophospholipase
MREIIRWEAVDQPRAAVQILHGMAEHAGRYERFATALNTAGFVVRARNHRGHGENPTGHFADQNGWRVLMDDAAAFAGEMKRDFPALPLFLFAHSMGSFLAQSLIAERGADYAGVILCGSGGPSGLDEGGGRLLAKWLRLVKGGRASGQLLADLAFGPYNRQFRPNRTNVDWLSRDTAEVDLYIADPRCGFPLTVQSWLDFLEGKQPLGTQQHIERVPKTLPVLIIGGTRDPVGANAKGLQRLAALYRAAGLTVDERYYEGARHELLNETNRDEVTRDVLAWLTRRPVSSTDRGRPGNPVRSGTSS